MFSCGHLLGGPWVNCALTNEHAVHPSLPPKQFPFRQTRGLSISRVWTFKRGVQQIGLHHFASLEVCFFIPGNPATRICEQLSERTFAREVCLQPSIEEIQSAINGGAVARSPGRWKTAPFPPPAMATTAFW